MNNVKDICYQNIAPKINNIKLCEKIVDISRKKDVLVIF
jgi:hypothetical protein